MEIEDVKSAENQPQKTKLKDIIKNTSPKKLLYFAIIILVSCPDFISGSVPLGVAVFAVEFSDKIPFFPGVVTLLAAFLPGFDFVFLAKYAAALILFSAIALRFPSVLENGGRRGVLAGLCTSVCSAISCLGTNFIYYDWLIFLLEGLIVFCASYLFFSAKRVIVTKKISEGASGEELFAVCSVLAAAIMGLDRLLPATPLPVSFVLCTVFSLAFCYTNGAYAGAVTGAFLGFIAGYSTGDVLSGIGIFAFSSLISGFFSKHGKTACTLVFIICFSLLSFYQGSGADSIFSLYSLISGAVIFMLIPSKLIDRFSVYGRRGKTSIRKSRKLLQNDLLSLSSSLNDLAKTYLNIGSNFKEKEKLRRAFFDRLTARSCDSCSLRDFCWKNDLTKTYSAFTAIMDICEKKGKLRSGDIPSALREKCPNISGILISANNMYELYRSDVLWESKILQSRASLSLQLSAVSDILKNLASKTETAPEFDTYYEDLISLALKNAGILTDEISVINEGDKKFADITVPQSAKSRDTEVFDAVASALPGARLIRKTENAYRFTSSGKYNLSVGSAAVPKSGSTVSGDTSGYAMAPDGTLFLLLSDGMGSGINANLHSSLAVNTLKRLLSAGFRPETAINAVNSVLLLKGDETAISTLDIAAVNLDTREIEFIKNGAPGSFIKNGEAVKKIFLSSLPSGVSLKTKSEKIKVGLRYNDMVIMLSDGVSSAFENSKQSLSDVISGYCGENPSELAKHILDCAEQLRDEGKADDMTALVARIS